MSQLLRAREVAELLPVTEDWIMRRTYEGVIPFHKSDEFRGPRFQLETVAQFVDEWKAARKLAETIYFVQAGDGGPIKIGRAIDVAARVNELQTGNPTELRVLATVRGSRFDEKRFHRQFAHAHLRREWFSPAPDLLAFIGRLVEKKAA